MEKKRIITPGTKWGLLTYVEELKGKKRPIKVICECGEVKTVQYGALNSGLTKTCKHKYCVAKLKDRNKAERDKIDIELLNRQKFRDSELNKLKEYWREVEKGQVHNVRHGMILTYDYLQLK